MIGNADIPTMTVRELAELAEAAASSIPGSMKAKQLTERMCAVSLYLEDSGAIQQLLWWTKGSQEPQAPPDARAKLFLLPSR